MEHIVAALILACTNINSGFSAHTTSCINRVTKCVLAEKSKPFKNEMNMTLENIKFYTSVDKCAAEVYRGRDI